MGFLSNGLIMAFFKRGGTWSLEGIIYNSGDQGT